MKLIQTCAQCRAPLSYKARFTQSFKQGQEVTCPHCQTVHRPTERSRLRNRLISALPLLVTISIIPQRPSDLLLATTFIGLHALYFGLLPFFLVFTTDKK